MSDGKAKPAKRLPTAPRDAGAENVSRGSGARYVGDPRASGTLVERLVAIDASLAAPASTREMRERVLAAVGPDPDTFRSRSPPLARPKIKVVTVVSPEGEVRTTVYDS